MVRPKADAPLTATERKRRWRQRKRLGLVGHRELTVEQKLTVANREIWNLRRIVRHHEREDAARAHADYSITAPLGMEINRLQHEVERLRALLAKHGIEDR